MNNCMPVDAKVRKWFMWKLAMFGQDDAQTGWWLTTYGGGEQKVEADINEYN